MLDPISRIVSEMPPWFRGTAAGAAVMMEHQAKKEERNQNALAEIATARAVHEQQKPDLLAAIATAKAATQQAMAALRAAERHERAAHGELTRSRLAVETIERQYLPMLNANAPAVIASFRAEIGQERDRILKDGLKYTREFTATSRSFGGPARTQQCSNIAGVRAVLLAISDVLTQTQELHLRVATEAEAIVELDRLRATIPFTRLEQMDPEPWLGADSAT